MIREYVQSLEGIDTFGIISLVLFVLFFAGVIIWIFQLDKKYFKEMSELPLDLINNKGENNEV